MKDPEEPKFVRKNVPVTLVRDHAPKEERVARVRDMMAAGTWSPAEIPKLAAEWGLSESAVRFCSSEASRHIRMHEDTRDALAMARRHLDAAARAAEESESPRDAVNAHVAIARTWTMMAGHERKVVEGSGETVGETEAAPWWEGETE